MDRKTNRTTEICTQGVVGIVALNQGGSQQREGVAPYLKIEKRVTSQ